MKTNGNDKALESYKIFPYVAWSLIFMSAYFVYNIAMELKMATEKLSAQTQLLQENVNTPVDKINNFES